MDSARRIDRQATELQPTQQLALPSLVGIGCVAGSFCTESMMMVTGPLRGAVVQWQWQYGVSAMSVEQTDQARVCMCTGVCKYTWRALDKIPSLTIPTSILAPKIPASTIKPFTLFST